MIRREVQLDPTATREQPEAESPRPSWPAWVAWIAHAYTGLGLVLAAGMAVCIFRGGAEAYRLAFALMLAACLVDSTDGSLARRLKVKRLLPHFDGAKLDDLIDFLTFTSLPLALVWRAELVPPGLQWVLVVALLASAYGFCQVPAKTSDGFFVGFPSYWNIVAFYLYVLHLPGWAAAMDGATSPSRMRFTRAPASRSSAMRSSWRSRSPTSSAPRSSRPSATTSTALMVAAAMTTG